MASLDVAIVHPDLSAYGGAQKLTLQLAEALSRSHHVTVYTSRFSSGKWSFLKLPQVVEVPLAKKMMKLPFYPLAATALQAAIREHQVYNLHSFPSYLISLHPSVWYCHEPPRELYDLSREYAARSRLPSPMSRIVLSALRAYDRAKALRVDAIASNSKFTRQYIRLAYGRDSMVVYPGVKLSAYKPREPESPLLLSVSRLIYHKNIHLVIESMKLIAKRIPEARLLIVGEGPERSRLISLIRALGLEASVRITTLDERALIEAYSEAYCLIYVPHREPFGLAVLEAMASSKPVVASREGGVRELVEDGRTGYLVSKSPAAIAWRAISLLKSREKAAEMGRLGLLRAHSFTLEKTASELSALLEEAAEASSTSSESTLRASSSSSSLLKQ